MLCFYQNIEIAKLLLEKGININLRDNYGNNALWYAVFNCKGRNYEMVELLMKFNPDILTKNNAGRSPLDFAIKVNNKKLINIMNPATTNKEIEYIAVRTWTEKRMIFIELTDGRIIGFPADRFKILKKATDKKLKEVKLALNGSALRWDNLDEDLTVTGIVGGRFQLP